MKSSILWIVFGILTALPLSSDAVEALGQSLLEKTVHAAKTNIFPSNDASVNYDTSTKQVHISFTTPQDYEGDSGDEYRRWRRNQWAVLQEFMLSKIPVDSVIIETNDVDGKYLIRYKHTARHVDKYGDIHGNRLWLRTARGTQKRIGSDKWEKIE